MSGSTPLAVRDVLVVAEAASWSVHATARELARRHGFGMVKCYRLASRLTLSELAEKIKQVEIDAGNPAPAITHARISRWETGKDVPSRRYLDALCRIYRTRPDLLGFGIDHSAAGPAGDAGGGSTPEPAVGTGVRQADEDAAGGADALRQRLVGLIQPGGVPESSVDWYEARVRHHGSNYRVLPMPRLAREILEDLTAMQSVLSHRQRLENQRRMTRVLAQLSGLMAVVSIDMHRPEASSRWFQAGNVAADEAGDPLLRAWLLTREALGYLYYGSPEEAIRLAKAARRLAGSSRCAAAAMAPAVEARGWARLRQAPLALDLIRVAERTFSRLDPGDGPPAVFGFPERKLSFYQGYVFARTAHYTDAVQAQRRALAGYGPEDAVDRGHVLLDNAICLVHQGEPEEAGRMASRVLIQTVGCGGAGALLSHAKELLDTTAQRYPTLPPSTLSEVIVAGREALCLQRARRAPDGAERPAADDPAARGLDR